MTEICTQNDGRSNLKYDWIRFFACIGPTRPVAEEGGGVEGKLFLIELHCGQAFCIILTFEEILIFCLLKSINTQKCVQIINHITYDRADEATYR